MPVHVHCHAVPVRTLFHCQAGYMCGICCCRHLSMHKSSYRTNSSKGSSNDCKAIMTYPSNINKQTPIGCHCQVPSPAIPTCQCPHLSLNPCARSCSLHSWQAQSLPGACTARAAAAAAVPLMPPMHPWVCPQAGGQPWGTITPGTIPSQPRTHPPAARAGALSRPSSSNSNSSNSRVGQRVMEPGRGRATRRRHRICQHQQLQTRLFEVLSCCMCCAL